ncbi:NADH-quinone oxidoreductase subunit N [Fodinibius salsisoli]|uniref:NADH-quinone oxidoreductase subunit N n=1 Tax=Fodinibius salsisoli TaxID=2820877 RepID=A0ABT3PJW7_9BACT|nr:NADH-quinone oxidoreductase subunit N [Fodinibius salsisoli]MCW9706234.1 NADH-quinone oxidoreductase subunit N [Fodinibius salsisoli]
MTKDLLLIMPQIAVLLTAIGSLIAEMMGKPRGSLWTLIIGMLAATGVAISKIGTITTAFSNTFRVDYLSLWAVIILSITNIFIAVLARSELKNTYREGTVYSLLVFSLLGALIMTGAGDIMFVVLGILISTLAGTALIAYNKTDPATEGAFKYYIYGSVTGAVMLFGLTFWVGIIGSTYLSALNNPELSSLAVIFGFITLLIGIGYAGSLVPFHFWTPDAFEASPVSIAAYLSVVPKVGAIFALAQVARELPVEMLNWPLLLGVIAVLSMTFGNVVALWQDNIVRLLAYSTIAQAGYFLLGVVAIQQNQLAVNALVVFGIAYAVMNVGAFAIVQSCGTQLKDFNGWAKQKPWQAVGMTIFLLSLVGVPPLAGFAGKFLLFGAALDGGYTWLAVAAIINSVISLAVYLRIIVPTYFNEPKPEPIQSTKPGIRLVWISTFVLTIAVGLGLQWFLV